jgi:hypothetical protein
VPRGGGTRPIFQLRSRQSSRHRVPAQRVAVP